MEDRKKKGQTERGSADKVQDKVERSSTDKSQERTERSSANNVPQKSKEKKSKVDSENSTNQSDEILNAVKAIQLALKNQDEKINSVTSRLDCMENYSYEEETEEYVHEHCENPIGAPGQGEETPSDSNEGQGQKRNVPDVDIATGSRFESMSKRFKNEEKCDVKVDETLAQNINELFLNGVQEDKYAELTNENNSRPENCAGLSVVKLNKLVWDAVSPAARTMDKKLQNIETSVIKAATMLVKVVNNMAILENDCPKYGEMIDNCNDVLALMGHSNRQINLTRRDLLRPELKEEYNHLCNHSLPYTKELFGDDVSKAAKDIEDSMKVGFKLHRGIGRGRFGPTRTKFRGRFRGGTPHRGRGFHPYQYPSTSTYGPTPYGPGSKNGPKRGQMRPQSRN